VTRRSVILEVCVRAEFHTLLLISLYLLFAGHNQPGGGFAGGLVAACAFCLLFVAGGEGSVRRVLRVPPTTFLGVGMLFSIVTGAVSLVLGGQFLESAIVEGHVALLGKVKGSSVLFFDIGVYLVVLGMVLLLLEQLGSADGTDPDAGADGPEMAP
jgi:multicomponent Na+:H+ antiporter subunit A